MRAAAAAAAAPRASFNVAAAEAVLARKFGFKQFRGQQLDAIRAVLEGRDVLYIAATGSGKSLLYQFPTQYLREAGPRAGSPSTTLVISPLLSLMEDQAMAMRQLGISVVALHSDTKNASQEWEKAMRGEYNLVYTTPESALSRLGQLQQLHASGALDLLAVDEAHTVSEWGVDFRPEFRRLSTLRAALPGVPMLALTATATPRVRADIEASLRLVNPLRVTATFNRPNLHYCVRMKTRMADDLSAALRQHGGSGAIIVYCNTIKATEEVADMINALQIPLGAGRMAAASSSAHGGGASSSASFAGTLRAAAYYGTMAPGLRMDVHQRFMRDELQVVVATIAFGMGIDKRDVKLVLHYGCPKTLEGLYQQTGRAGRDGDPASCVMYWSHADFATLSNLMSSNPSSSSSSSSPSSAAAERRAYAQPPQGPSIQDAGFEAVKSFVLTTAGCRRQILLNYFGEAAPDSCSGCDNCDRRRAAAEATSAAAATGGLAAGHFDFTAHVRLLLQALDFAGPSVGLSRAIDIVMGSKAAKLLAAYGLPRLQATPCYGKGAGVPDRYWQGVLRLLLEHKFAAMKTNTMGAGGGGRAMSYTSYPVTPAGRAFAASSTATLPPAPIPEDLLPYMARAAWDGRGSAPSSSPSSSLRAGGGGGGGGSAAGPLSSSSASTGLASAISPAEEAVHSALEALRRTIAAEQGVAPYAVCSASALAGMALARPADEAALQAAVEGWGEAKLAAYGGRFLATLRQSCAEQGLELGGSGAADKASSSSSSAAVAQSLLGPVHVSSLCLASGVTETKQEAWVRVILQGAAPAVVAAAKATAGKPGGIKPETVTGYIADCIDKGLASTLIRGFTPDSVAGGGAARPPPLPDFDALARFVLVTRCGCAPATVTAISAAVRTHASQALHATLHWLPLLQGAAAAPLPGGPVPLQRLQTQAEDDAEVLLGGSAAAAPGAPASPALKLAEIMARVQPEALRDYSTLKLVLSLIRARHLHLGELAAAGGASGGSSSAPSPSEAASNASRPPAAAEFGDDYDEDELAAIDWGAIESAAASAAGGSGPGGAKRPTGAAAASEPAPKSARFGL